MRFTKKFQELKIDYDELYKDLTAEELDGEQIEKPVDTNPDGWLHNAKLQYIMQLNAAISERKKESEEYQSTEGDYLHYLNNQYKKDHYSLNNIEEDESLEAIALQKFQSGEAAKIILEMLSRQLAGKLPLNDEDKVSDHQSDIQKTLGDYNFSKNLAKQIAAAILYFDRDANMLGYKILQHRNRFNGRARRHSF